MRWWISLERASMNLAACPLPLPIGLQGARGAPGRDSNLHWTDVHIDKNNLQLALLRLATVSVEQIGQHLGSNLRLIGLDSVGLRPGRVRRGPQRSDAPQDLFLAGDRYRTGVFDP